LIDPLHLMAMLAYAALMAVTILIGFRMSYISERTSVRGKTVNLMMLAHLALLHLVTLQVFLRLPREVVLVPAALVAIAMPSFAIPLLLRLHAVFVRRETQVEDIEWSVVGLKTGLMKMYRIWLQVLLSTVRNALPNEVIAGTLEELKAHFKPLERLEVDGKGIVSVDLQSADDLEVDEIVRSFTLVLNRIYMYYRVLLGSAADARIREIYRPLLRSCSFAVREKPQIGSSLFGGILSGRASTGTMVDDYTAGGIQRGTALLVEGSEGASMRIFRTSFMYQALLSGEDCLYLTCSRDPGNLREDVSRFAGMDPSRLHIIHCGEKANEESREQSPDLTCPNFGLVDFSVEEALGRGGLHGGRAVIDIIPSWIAACRANGMAPVITGLARTIETLRKGGFATVIMLDLGELEPHERSIIAEMVGASLQLRESGSKLALNFAKGFSESGRSPVLRMEDWEASSISRLAEHGPLRREDGYPGRSWLPRPLQGPRGAIQVLQAFEEA
jgi:KaiC/GvpD/RAD55 family RecA-like ATPase